MLPPRIRELLASPTSALKGNFIRDAWDLLAKIPGGPRLYSAFIGRVAPYTGSMGATVTQLGRGYCTAVLEERRAVRNHLGSVHAIALVNLAELCGNLALTYGLPDDARFIVAGLSIEYLKKARGVITATCQLDPVTTSEKREYPVSVELRDADGTLVARATLRTLVGPKPTA